MSITPFPLGSGHDLIRFITHGLEKPGRSRATRNKGMARIAPGWRLVSQRTGPDRASRTSRFLSATQRATKTYIELRICLDITRLQQPTLVVSDSSNCQSQPDALRVGGNGRYRPQGRADVALRWQWAEGLWMRHTTNDPSVFVQVDGTEVSGEVFRLFICSVAEQLLNIPNTYSPTTSSSRLTLLWRVSTLALPWS